MDAWSLNDRVNCVKQMGQKTGKSHHERATRLTKRGERTRERHDFGGHRLAGIASGSAGASGDDSASPHRETEDWTFFPGSSSAAPPSDQFPIFRRVSHRLTPTGREYVRASRWLAPKLSIVRVEFLVGMSFKKMSCPQHSETGDQPLSRRMPMAETRRCMRSCGKTQGRLAKPPLQGF